MYSSNPFSSLLLVLLASCATVPEQRSDWLYLDGKYSSDNNPNLGLPVSPYEIRQFDEETARGNTNLDNTGFMERSSNIARNTFKKLCAEATGKKMEISVTGIVPKMPAGMPLNQSNELRDSLLNAMRNRMSQFYQNNFVNYKESVRYYLNGLESKKIADDLKFSCPNQTSGVFYSIGKNRNLVFTFSPPAYYFHDGSIESKSYACSYDALYFLTLDRTEEPTTEKIRTCYIWSSPKGLKLKPYGYKSNYDGFKLNENVECGELYQRPDERKYFSVRRTEKVPYQDQLNSIERNASEILISDEQKITAYPFKPSRIAELTLLAKWYTIKPSNVDSADRLVKDQAKIWEAYINRYTKVDESQTSNPDEINFKIQLDLAPFCASGRHFGDVLSQ